MQSVTVPFVIYGLTGSAAWLGISAACTFVPTVIVGPIAGAVADRYARRQVLLITQTIQMLAAFALWGVWVSGHATVASILGLTDAPAATSNLELARGAGTPGRFAGAPSRAATAGVSPRACPSAARVADTHPGASTLAKIGDHYGMGALRAQGDEGAGVTIAAFELAPTSRRAVPIYHGCFGLDPDSPDEAQQLAPHGGNDLALVLACRQKPRIASGQPNLRLAGNLLDLFRHILLSLAQRRPDARPEPITPGGFHCNAPQMRVAGLGNAPALRPLAAGVLAGDRAAVSHQLPRALKAG